uniref:Uncharacterized protein n=1 Tax=Romanomermis culicivorax TaxID=13658 RepID=A0A915K0F8_ROMCU
MEKQTETGRYENKTEKQCQRKTGAKVRRAPKRDGRQSEMGARVRRAPSCDTINERIEVLYCLGKAKNVGDPVAGKVTIRKSTCKSTKWTTGGTDNSRSNGAPQKDQKMMMKSLLFLPASTNKPLPSNIVLICINYLVHWYYGSCEGPEAQALSLAHVKQKEDCSRDPSDRNDERWARGKFRAKKHIKNGGATSMPKASMDEIRHPCRNYAQSFNRSQSLKSYK